MKIKITDNETYEFKLPEIIDGATFMGLFNRFKSIKSLFETELIPHADNDLPYKKKGYDKSKSNHVYTPRKKQGIASTVRENINEIVKLFYCENATSPENEARLKSFVERKGLVSDRNRLSICISYFLHKINKTKQQILSE